MKMKKYRENIWFLWVLLIGLFFQLMYVSTSSANVPIMDYWKYINMFVEKLNTGVISLSDIWQNDGIHRSPLQFILFLLNVKLFHLNTQVEIYLGALLMAIMVVVLYKAIKKELFFESPRANGLIGVIFVITIYNLNQYELLNEQFALSFACRMLLFQLSFILTSGYLQSIEKKKTATLKLGIYYILVIESVGSGFFPAYVVAIAVTIILHYLLYRKKEKNKYWKEYLFLLLCLIIGTCIYLYGVLGNQSVIAGAESIKIGDFIKNFLIGVVTMLGVSILGFEYSEKVILVAGIIIFILYFCSFILYLKKKYYKRTYVPVAFFCYAMGAMGLIYLGRMGRFGLSYAYSPRYVCETNVALLGFLWIIILYISDNINRYKGKKYLKETSVAVAVCCVFIGGILVSDYKEWKIAPYRKVYCENLIENMLEIETLSDEDFAPFQANEDVVRSGVEIMQKYDLGVFYNN